MTLILGAPKVQIFNTDGTLMAGGKVYTYDAGTSNSRASYPTWDDAIAETNANANPVILDSRGEADIVLKGPTKVTVTDANDVTLWSVDDLDTSTIDIVDVEGGAILTFTGVTGAVNHIQISNAAAGNPISIDAAGDDTNIGLEFKCKGSEDFYISKGDLILTAGDYTTTSGNMTLNSGDISASNGTVTVSDGEINLQNSVGGFTFLPAGAMTWFAGSSVPDGWLECDGSAVSRTTYATLFGNISTTFGIGDGSTTFNLPNQERRVLVGKGGTGTGTLGNTTGSTGGAETHTLSSGELATHNHECDVYDRATASSPIVAGSNANYGGATSSANRTTDSVGGGGSHNILQPSLVMMLIIRAF